MSLIPKKNECIFVVKPLELQVCTYDVCHFCSNLSDFCPRVIAVFLKLLKFNLQEQNKTNGLMRRVNKRPFILLITCPPLPSFVYPPSAPALLLQGVPLHTGAPHVILTGDAGGGGVLKEFASPDASSLQIQATPRRSCIVHRTLWIFAP